MGFFNCLKKKQPPKPVEVVPNPPVQTHKAYYLSTRGADLYDVDGNKFLIRGINWFGFETSNLAPHGIWQRNYKDMVKQVADLGFNTVRLPFTNAILKKNVMPTGIDFSQNQELENATPLGLLRLFLLEFERHGIRVILDRHCPTPNLRTEFWYTDEVPEEKWIYDWTILAEFCKAHPNVIGFDLHNEPRESCEWAPWAKAASRCGNAILDVNPNLLIIVEGTQYYWGTQYWWGGNLKGVENEPVLLKFPNRLVYSAHDYPSSVYLQEWFQDISQIEQVWNTFWGFVVYNEIAPVLLGEFGTRLKTPDDAVWLSKLLSYMENTGVSWTYWCLNPNSGDTGGILQNDWISVHEAKYSALKPYLRPVK